MSYTRHLRFVALPIVALLLAWPSLADAQRRPGGRRPPARAVVVVGGFGYPRYGYYDPFLYDYDRWSQWGPYPGSYGPYGPYGGYALGDQFSSVRLEVTPRQADVIVDGYSAGTVDDFDGIFQRLRLRPGNHEIALYLPGYHTLFEKMYLNPGADQKLKRTMEPLAAGEVSEPPPQPATPPATYQPDASRDRQQPPVQRRPAPGPDSRTDDRPAPRPAAADFGTLSLRVQPGDAEIVVDGERWSAPGGQDRIAIQLAEGRHHVEVRKDGFSQYTEDVLIRRDSTMTLNVSLLRGNAPAAPR